jgi:aldehyde dehydrogenase (NAD+)
VSKSQHKRVLDYIKIGQEEGAEIVAQAKLPFDFTCLNGFFVPPTLVKVVARERRIAKERSLDWL